MSPYADINSNGPPANEIVSGTDQALSGTGLQRANQLVANPHKDRSGRPYTQWVDPTAFAAPALGTYGNVGWNSLVGPSTWQFDTALSRTFNLHEMQRFEARVEAFNVTNSFIPAGVSGTVTTGGITIGNSIALNSNTFGQIRTALSPRILQFALKYVF
jgi:hypothetical protein